MSKERVSLSDQVRRAVKQSSMSRYAISKATGIDQAVLSRFVAGKVGMMMDTLDLLADVLDLHIVVGKPKTRKAV